MAKITETEWIWRDGEFIRWADATTHILCHSLQFGSAVFEGIRCYSTPRGPAVFRLESHLERMLGSCKIYRMDVRYSIDELVAATCELVERNGVDACYIRPMVVRGYGASGMVPIDSPVEVYVPCWPWGAYLGDRALEEGIDACVSTWNRVAPNTIPSMAKVGGNYLSGQLVKMEALRNGFGEGIALTTDGMVSEGSGQNLFLVYQGELYTPTINGTLLHGITRNSILTLARDAGLTVREQELPREMLYLADEIFLCGTASEVTPVRSVDRITIGNGKRGPVTTQIQQRFLDLAKGASEDPYGWLTYVRAERAAKQPV
ncbi:MAG TPA: branched-chain amino acid transaminase [Gemmatimonadaceae bacterium]|jgi:branched-chain amino acid aminotransferase|nr:branched-chain amino acid transaminase [Gemmatimonadaceae bacterium]